ncbi:CopM family metallochaperone [Psychrobacter ciconiae]|uniref:CopM family metallochaperone n=1 Tax=Psychrobacter ciconiae TaxID=1553449 RepID=UPI00191AD667|nr:DUF305 domain-containing protein [Psychrobacter ciconiae]
MITDHKLRLSVIAVGTITALLLSACQPAKNEAEVTTSDAEVTEVETQAATAEASPHANHDMSADMASDDASMSAMHQEYSASMTKMHEEMMVGMSYNDPDMAFAQGMLGHHIGAVDMAKIQLKYGTDAEMRKLAQDIIDAQQSEIATMKSWLANHSDAQAPTPDTEDMQKDYADGMDEMHEDMMEGIADPRPDMAFARGMLPHHVGAVDMAKVQLKYGKDAEMRKLAQDIIDAQEPEIKQMENWIDRQDT